MQESTTKTDYHWKNNTKLDKGLFAPFKKTGFFKTLLFMQVTYPDLEAQGCCVLDKKVEQPACQQLIFNGGRQENQDCRKIG